MEIKLIQEQSGGIIHTIHPSNNVHARIFSEEQRQRIKQLMAHGFIPHHSSVGKENCSWKHWRIMKYIGKYGKGFKMITSSPYSSNFNHITYFTIA